MIKPFLNHTDNFLGNSVKNIFEKAENICKSKNKEFNLFKELENLKEDPIVSILSDSTKFEQHIKLKIKIMLGIFFVAIPLIVFMSVVTYLNLHPSYAFISTLVVAILATSRMDEIVNRYALSRTLEASY